MHHRFLSIAIIATASLLTCNATPQSTPSKTHTWEFFAFDNAVGRGKWKPQQQANILAKLGYNGIGYTGTKNIPAMLKALKNKKQRFYTTYVHININPKQPPYSQDLIIAIKQLQGTNAILWATVKGAKKTPQADAYATKVLQQLADIAKKSGIRIALYPHTGFYVATMKDAVRLTKLTNRKNVGATFNLCHYLKQNSEANLTKQLTQAAPHLMLVSINGADSGNTQKMSWNKLIQPLDSGTFNITNLLQTLKKLKYTGPIGLQGYAIKGDTKQNLKKSITAWQAINANLK